MTKGMTAAAVFQNMITPNAIRLDKNTDIGFASDSLATPVVWSLGAGSVGSIDPVTGIFSTGAVAGAASIIATDANAIVSESDCYVADPLVLVPDQDTNITIEAGMSFTFGASDGVPGYKFYLASPPDGVSIDEDTGVLSVDASFTGTMTAAVAVRDRFLNEYSSVVYFAGQVKIDPPSVNVEINGTQQFSAVDGVQPFVFSLVSGGGSVDPDSGLYTAPSSGIGTNATVRVTDVNGYQADAVVALLSDLAVAPNHAPEAVLKGTTRQFSGAQGTGPYSFSKVSGAGAVDSAGLYTADNARGSAVLRVTDAIGSQADVNVAVSPVIDRSVQGDGTDGFIDCGNILDFDKDAPFSLSAWIKVSSQDQGNGSEFAIMSKMDDLGSGNFKGWVLYGLFSFVFQAANDSFSSDQMQVDFDVSPNLAPDVWHHIVLTYDGSGSAAGLSFYFDNVAVLNNPLNDALSATPSASANALIGKAGVIGINSCLSKTCSVSTYSIALNSDQVAELFNSGEPGDVAALSSYASCLNYWKLGQDDTYPDLADAKSAQTAVMTNLSSGDIVVGDAP